MKQAIEDHFIEIFFILVNVFTYLILCFTRTHLYPILCAMHCSPLCSTINVMFTGGLILLPIWRLFKAWRLRSILYIFHTWSVEHFWIRTLFPISCRSLYENEINYYTNLVDEQRHGQALTIINSERNLLPIDRYCWYCQSDTYTDSKKKRVFVLAICGTICCHCYHLRKLEAFWLTKIVGKALFNFNEDTCRILSSVFVNIKEERTNKRTNE